MRDDDSDGLVVTRLTITKLLAADDGVIIRCESEGDPAYLEILGLLELAKPPECWGLGGDD